MYYCYFFRFFSTFSFMKKIGKNGKITIIHYYSNVSLLFFCCFRFFHFSEEIFPCGNVEGWSVLLPDSRLDQLELAWGGLRSSWPGFYHIWTFDIEESIKQWPSELQAWSLSKLIIFQLRINGGVAARAPDSMYIKIHHFQLRTN